MDVLGLATGAMNAGLGILNNEQTHWYTKDTMRYGYDLNEKAAQNADIRTRSLYHDIYSPQALMKNIREAGLSPSVFYGGTPGQGGTSGAQGGTGTVGTTYTPVSMLEGAQIANIMAQTEKTKAETKTIEPMANATVSSLLAEAGYKKAAEAAAAAQAEGTKLDNYVKENTKDASIYQICELADQASHEAQKAYYEMKEAKLLMEFDQDTFENRKKLIRQQFEQIAQSIAESKSAERLNDQQRSYVKVLILDNIDAANREWAKYRLSREQFETFIEKQIPIMEKTLEKELESLDIEKKRMIINAVTDTFKSLAMGAMAASSMGLGKGGDNTATVIQQAKTTTPRPTGKGPGQTTKKGTTSVWSY